MTVSEIAATQYCEQKLVFDRRHGKSTPAYVAARAVAGSFEHRRFELEGYTSAPAYWISKVGRTGRLHPGDRRCFIASVVYGPDAPQTDALRAWRDSRLLPFRLGRVAIRVYYVGSPFVAALLAKHHGLRRLAAAILDPFAGAVRSKPVSVRKAPEPR